MKVKGINSPLVSVLFGVGAAGILCLALTAVISQLMITQTVGEASAGIFVTLILLLASMSGTWLSVSLQSNNILKTVVLTIVGILLTVVVGAFLISGSFQNVGLRVAAILGGGLISCVICMKTKGRIRKRKRRYR